MWITVENFVDNGKSYPHISGKVRESVLNSNIYVEYECGKNK